MPLSTDDRNFLSKELKKYFGSRLGSSQAVNGGGAVTLVGGTAAIILEQNDFRMVATIVNTDTVNDLYLNFSNNTAVTATGILLKVNGGSITFGRGTDIPYTGRVWAISAGTPTVVFTEISIPE